MSAIMDRVKDREGSPSLRMSDEDLRGRAAISADGQVMGEVSAVLFDSCAWRVESLKVRLRKEVADQLGVGRGVFRAGVLEIPVRMVQAVGDTVVLSCAVHGLRELAQGEQAACSTVPKEDDVDR
jgi:sporulation protein YlmC with PRC-barrel domain